MNTKKILKLVHSDTCLCPACYFSDICHEFDFCPLNPKEYLVELKPEEYEMLKSDQIKEPSIS